MTTIVRVKSKETGNVFEIDEENVNDTVDVVDPSEVELTPTEESPFVEFVEVRSKDNPDAIFTIDRQNVNDTVEIVNDELPPGAPDNSWTRDQLDLYAARNGVNVAEAKTKADVLSAIQTPPSDQGGDGNVG